MDEDMGIRITVNRSDIDFTQAARLLGRNGIRRNAEDVRKAFENSAYAVYAVDGNTVAAVGRALSDRRAWTLVTDVAVLPGYERTGEALLEQILANFRGHELFAYSGYENIPLFEAHGFRRSKNSFTYAGPDDRAIDPALLAGGYFLPVGYRFETEFAADPGKFPVGRKNTMDRSALQLRYTQTTEGLDFARLNEVLELAFGGRKRDTEATRETFTNSPYTSFAFDGEKLVACARAESDGVAQGFILNVAVDPEYQGLHLGTEVIDRLAAQMKGQNIFLNTHPGGVGFYNRKGFRRNKTALLYPAHPDMPAEAAKGFVLPKGYRFADEIR